MEYRGKPRLNPLHVYRPRGLLSWHSEPALRRAAQPERDVQDQWSMRTVDRAPIRLADEIVEEPLSPALAPSVTSDKVSSLDLAADDHKFDPTELVPKRPRRVTRVFHTCKSFLHQKLRRKH